MSSSIDSSWKFVESGSRPLLTLARGGPAGRLQVAARLRDDENGFGKVSSVWLYLMKRRKFSLSRWVGVGVCRVAVY